MNQGIFDFALPKVDWKGVPDLTKLPSWSQAKRIGIDIETRDPTLKQLGPGCRRDPKTNYVVGIGIAIEDGPDFYLPFSHEGGDNLPKEHVVNYVNDNLKDFKGVVAGANLGYEGDWLATTGIDILGKKHADVQVSDVLIWELHDNYDLDTLCTRWEIPGKDERALREAASVYKVHPKTGLWKLPARYVDAYCRGDARKPLQILRRQEMEMEKLGINQIWELEQKVTPILTKMRRRGVRVDLDKVDQIEKKCLEIEWEMCRKVKHATMIDVSPDDLMNAESLARALRIAGYEPGKTVKGKASVDKELLKECGYVGEWLLEAREWHHLRITYCKQIRDHAIYHGPDDWRVHTTTNQVRATDEDGGGRGVRYGRTSCTDPSMQNQPIRSDKFGALWRSIFIKKKGSAGWACSDWSQQEPRIGVHYAELLEKQSGGRICRGAKEFGDEYRRNPALDIHQKLTDVADDPVNYPRKVVKNFVNGRLYGMGDLKLCYQLNWSTEIVFRRGEEREVPTAESYAKIKKFNDFAPWIGGLTKAATEAAEKNGHVWTFLRRRCNFVKGPDGKIWKAHKAFNRVGQGSAADQMKATLVAADGEGIPVDLIVHDEFDFSYDDLKQAKRLRELQKHTVEFSVPMKVDLEVGENWGEVEKVPEDQLN